MDVDISTSETKYRAYDIEKKEWITDFVLTPSGKCMIKVDGDESEGTKARYKTAGPDVILMPSVGLDDINGQPIFVGDIVLRESVVGRRETRYRGYIIKDGIGFNSLPLSGCYTVVAGVNKATHSSLMAINALAQGANNIAVVGNVFDDGLEE